ncbi:transcription factor Pdr1p [Monosporozyma servazzii]
MTKSDTLSSDARVSKNTRNKVRKACDSCRKRKIKCTGTQPCSSCQAYNCECNFSGKGSTNINTLKIETTPVNRSYSSQYNSSSPENIANQSVPVANGYPQQNISSIRSQHDQQTNPSSLEGIQLNPPSSYASVPNPGYMNVNSSTSTQPLQQEQPLKNVPVVDSCPFSRSELLKNQTTTSTTSSEENNDKDPGIFKRNSGVYTNNTNVEKQISNLDIILSSLTALEDLIGNEQDSKAVHVSEAIKSIKEQLAEINNNWQPQIDLNQYKEVNKRAVKSMETYLLKNKYSETVPITKFAISGDKQLEQTLINSDANSLDDNAQLHITQYPVVDEMFGLYSAYELFSLRGIGACFTKLIEKKEHCAGASKSMKETLYLTLRFFDMAMSHFHVNSVSIGNPIESYLQMKKIPIPQTPTSNSNSPLAQGNSTSSSAVNNQASFSSVSTANPLSPSGSTSSASGSSLSSVNTKALVAILIKMLPQPFVESHTGISNKQLLESMYDDVLMFKLLLEMYAVHIKSIDKFMREMSTGKDSNFSNYNSMNNSTKTIKTADTHKMLNFADEGELLLALMYTYYNSTLYTYFNPDSSLEYLELLIRLLDEQLWTEDKHGYHKVLGSAIQRALTMGLSRWEYYVGLDEFYAERKRVVWWKLYCHEKGNSLKSGVTSVINDNIMTCLLPRCFRDLGFLDNRDFLERVTEVKRNEIFDHMSIDSLISYGKTAALQIYSEFHLKVLLNERYTSIRNASLPPRLKTERFREILEQSNITQKKLTAVKEQVKKLSEIAENPTLYESLLSKEEIIKAMKFCIYFGNIYSVVISTLDNLDARFSFRVEDSSLSLMPHLLVLLDYWKSISQILLRFEDTYTINDSFFNYSTILIIMMTHVGELIAHLNLEDVVVIFKIFGRLSTFPIVTENEKYHQILDSNLFKSYCRTLSITALYCNMILKCFSNKKGIEEKDLVNSLRNIAPDILVLVEDCADPRAWPYRYLMRPVAKSGFHIKIKKMLKYIGVNDGLLEDKPLLRNNSVGQGATGLNNPNNVMMNHNSPVSTTSFPKKPSLSSTRFSLTPTVSSTGSTLISDSNKSKSQDHLIGALPTGQPQEFSAFDGSIDTPAYNIGTLDEFVENNDLTDLYDALWGDLYTNN